MPLRNAFILNEVIRVRPYSNMTDVLIKRERNVTEMRPHREKAMSGHDVVRRPEAKERQQPGGPSTWKLAQALRSSRLGPASFLIFSPFVPKSWSPVFEPHPCDLTLAICGQLPIPLTVLVYLALNFPCKSALPVAAFLTLSYAPSSLSTEVPSCKTPGGDGRGGVDLLDFLLLAMMTVGRACLAV